MASSRDSRETSDYVWSSGNEMHREKEKLAF